MPARRDVGQPGTGAVRPTCSPHLTAFAFMWSRAQVISIFAAVASRAESLSFQCRWQLSARRNRCSGHHRDLPA